MIDIKSIKQEIEHSAPLILNITNTVTMDFMANTLLALGASPIMSDDSSDALELCSISQAININIGTLNKHFIDIAKTIATKNDKKKPLILDPVGCGASSLRTETSRILLPYCTTLRGNASEIVAITSHKQLESKGVDSLLDNQNPLLSTAMELISKEYSIPVVTSGQQDIIYQNDHYYKSEFGTKLMTKVTGMGCVLTSVIAAFNTVISSPDLASHVGVMFYNLCGEIAIKKSTQPSSFKSYFIDTIFTPDYDYIQQKINSTNK